MFANRINNGILYNRSTFNQSKNSVEMSVVKDSISSPSQKSIDVLNEVAVGSIREKLVNYDAEILNK